MTGFSNAILFLDDITGVLNKFMIFLYKLENFGNFDCLYVLCIIGK